MTENQLSQLHLDDAVLKEIRALPLEQRDIALKHLQRFYNSLLHPDATSKNIDSSKVDLPKINQIFSDIEKRPTIIDEYMPEQGIKSGEGAIDAQSNYLRHRAATAESGLNAAVIKIKNLEQSLATATAQSRLFSSVALRIAAPVKGRVYACDFPNFKYLVEIPASKWREGSREVFKIEETKSGFVIKSRPGSFIGSVYEDVLPDLESLRYVTFYQDHDAGKEFQKFRSALLPYIEPGMFLIEFVHPSQMGNGPYASLVGKVLEIKHNEEGKK
jgi:hypothetical protein